MARLSREQTCPILILVVVQVFFGGNAIVSKIAVKSIDPVFFCFFRDLGASLLLGYLSSRWDHTILKAPRLDELVRFGLLGLTGVTGAMVCFVYAMTYITPLHASLYQPLQPILVLVLSIYPFRIPSGLVIRWPPTWKCSMQVFGLFCAVVGAIVVPCVKGAATHGGTSFGTVLILCSVTLGSVYQLLNKQFLEAWGALARTTWTYVFGTVFITIILPWRTISMDSIDFGVFCALVYAVFLTSGFNYVAMSWVNQHSGPALVTAFLPLQVVVTAILEWLFLSEQPSIDEMAGGTLIVIGLSCVSLFAEDVKATDAQSDKVNQQLVGVSGISQGIE